MVACSTGISPTGKVWAAATRTASDSPAPIDMVPSLKAPPWGRLHRALRPRRHMRQVPQRVSRSMVTRSPIWGDPSRPAAASPASTTRPAASWPGATG